MDKSEAVKAINKIRSGSGVDKREFPETMKGSIAKDLWQNGKFGYGFEYGYILGLMEAFNIKEEDL